MIRAFALLLALLPLPAAAVCNGPDFISTLNTAERAALYDQAAGTRYGEGLFYRATRDGKTLHILGTMHLPDTRHDALRARVAPQLATSGLLLVEATATDQTAMQTYMANNADLMTLPADRSLPALLDTATWDAVAAAASARGIPPFMAAKMQPWFLSLTLAIPPCAMQQMASGAGGLDALIMDAATSQGIPTAPLEAWQDMFALLTSGTFDEQIDALRLSLIDADAQDALIVSLVDSYFAGQVALSWHVSRYTADLIPDMDRATFNAMLDDVEQTLLTDRNRAWVPVIEAASADHAEVFVAFGAAHLIGDDGVLHLLAQNGWTITKRR